MSAETSEWLNRNILVGNTNKRGNAWHFNAAAQGDESNHYPGPIPVADILRRLLYWEALPVRIALVEEVLTGINDDGTPRYDLGYDQVPVEHLRAIMRSDTRQVWQVPTCGYTITQYRDSLLRRLEALVLEGLDVENAGLLKGGGRAFVQAALPDSIEVAGLAMRPTLLAADSHDGTLSETHKLVFNVVVCDNTLAMALMSSTPTVKFKHTSGERDKVALIADGLGLVETAAAKAKRDLETLALIRVTDDQMLALAGALIKPSGKGTNSVTIADRKRGEVMTLWDSDERVAPVKGTALGAVQTFNTWRHHVQTVKGVAARAERNYLQAVGNAGQIADRQTVAAVLDITGAKLTVPA